MSPPTRAPRVWEPGAPESEGPPSRSDTPEDSGALGQAPACRFCAGSGLAPADSRDDTDRFAVLARHAAGNRIWDWSGRERKRGGVRVLPTLAVRLAEAVRELQLNDDELRRVLRAVGRRHGREVARMVLRHLGRLGVAS